MPCYHKDNYAVGACLPRRLIWGYILCLEMITNHSAAVGWSMPLTATHVTCKRQPSGVQSEVVCNAAMQQKDTDRWSHGKWEVTQTYL